MKVTTQTGHAVFCGKVPAENQKIKDMAIMTWVRAYLEKLCQGERLQVVLINHWKHEANNTHVLLMDATCYEFEGKREQADGV